MANEDTRLGIQHNKFGLKFASWGKMQKLFNEKRNLAREEISAFAKQFVLTIKSPSEYLQKHYKVSVVNMEYGAKLTFYLPQAL